MRKLFAGLATVVALAACQESISTPGDCPTLCPGEQIIVRDTIIVATAGGDSTFFGYFPRSSNSVLLVSAGLAAGELRSFMVFPKQRRDSIQVDGTARALVVDTISISFTLQARDSTAKGLTVFLHRLPITIDTAISFDALQRLIAAAPAFDSIAVPDTLKAGKLEALYVGGRLPPLTLPSMPCCLKFIMAGKSSFGAETLMPIFAKECPASSNISDACSNAFDGMQPTLRQVPPSVAFFSTTATFMPSCAARTAQTYPPGPVPITTRS